MIRKSVLALLFFVLLCKASPAFAQSENDYVKTDKDKFQDHFYEALKQKGIENHDKAIVSQKCPGITQGIEIVLTAY